MVRSQCPVCSLQFLTEQSRNDHIIRVHLQNEDEYRCTTCSGLFKSEINLRKHFERYHPNTEAMEITKPDSDDDSIENMSKGSHPLFIIYFKTVVQQFHFLPLL